QKRQELLDKYFQLPKQLKPKTHYQPLTKLPPHSSPTPLTPTSKLTPPPTPLFTKFQISPIPFTQHPHKAQIPPLKKSS
ncbi:30S ribosomal protein S14, partial [Staphylococcus warneri]|uniref:30S ribosomal protein S14 n=1 Tax=Staphylococcus warneri TaxID=1292 RepID=UPI0011A1A7E3